MMKRIVALLLLALLRCAPVYGDRGMTVSADYCPGGRTTGRIDLDGSIWRLSMLHRIPARTPAYSRFSAVCPYLVIGSLASAGLLQEVSDPVGYGPVSTIYDRRTGFSPDSNLTRSGPMGGVLLLPGRGWDIQLPMVIYPYSGAGIIAAMSPAEGFGISGLCLGSSLMEIEESESWFSDTPAFRTQDCALAAISLSGSSAAFTVQAAGGMSVPRRLPSGWFARGRVGLSLELFSVTALCAGCDSHYLTPMGGYPDDLFGYGVEITLFDGKPMRFSLDLERRLGRRPLVPEYLRNVEESVEGEACISAGIIRVTMGLQRNILWECDGAGHITDSVNLAAGCRVNPGRISAGLRFRQVDDGEMETRVRLEADMGTEYLSGSIFLVCNDPGDLDAGLSFSFHGEGFSVTLAGNLDYKINSKLEIYY